MTKVGIRRHSVHECDHMRLVVRDDDGMWCHLAADGHLAGECQAGVYRVEAVTAERHVTSKAVLGEAHA